MADNRFDARARALRRLAALPDALKAEVAEQLEKSARELAVQIRDAAPVDDGVLRDSVGSRDISTPGRLAQMVHAGDGEAFYARFVEFGTPETTAQPFFFPVYRANKKRIRAAVGRAIGRGARKAVAKP